MLLSESYGGRRKRPGEAFGGEAEGEADQPEVVSKPLTPAITATSANGPMASVPAPQVGAPSKQPILQAPAPAAPPQSVAGIAFGGAPKVNMAPLGSKSNPGFDADFAQKVAAQSGTPAPTPQVGAPEPIKTLSGDWTPPTASAQSAPLIASAAGGTMTPGGDLGNTMRGYQSAEGGTFGQEDTGDRAQALRALESVSGVDSGTTYRGGVYGGGDPSKFGLGPNATSTEITALSKQNGLIANGDPGAIKAALASANPWLKANAEREAAKHPEIFQEGAVSRLQGNATAKDPAEQQRLLAEMEAGTIPSGPQVGPPITHRPADTIMPFPGIKTTGVPAGGAGGGGGAPAVGVGPSGTPAFPSTPSLPAPTVGAPGDLTDLDPVQKAMRDETLRRLQNPSPYDDELWQKEVGRAKASSDEQWKGARDNLDADLAARGINWSSVAGDKLSDFNTAKSRSWDDTLTGFLSDRAKGIGAARDQAFNAGSTERTYYDKLRQDAIGNQFDVTTLAEKLRQGREGTDLDWTKLGLDALGNSTNGAADLGAGAAASAGNTGTGDYISQWLAQFYGKKKPKPAVGSPPTVNDGLQ